MNVNDREINSSKLSSRASLGSISFILGIGALWFAWFQYGRLINQQDFYWYNWVQLAMISLIGGLSLWAAILFVLGKPSARDFFKLGLAVVPILLFANLVAFLFRVFQNILQGNTGFFFERLFAQPYRILLILVLLIALTALGSLNQRKDQ